MKTSVVKNSFFIRDCAIITGKGGGGGWKMGKMWLKSTLHPPYTKQKLISTPLHLVIMLRSNPPFLSQLVGKSSSRINITSCRMAKNNYFHVDKVLYVK